MSSLEKIRYRVDQIHELVLARKKKQSSSGPLRAVGYEDVFEKWNAEKDKMDTFDRQQKWLEKFKNIKMKDAKLSDFEELTRGLNLVCVIKIDSEKPCLPLDDEKDLLHYENLELVGFEYKDYVRYGELTGTHIEMLPGKIKR